MRRRLFLAMAAFAPAVALLVDLGYKWR